MNQSTAIVWMNITTSANWQRPPVGIVRVERSLCAELAKLYGTRFKTCVWDGRKFIERTPYLRDQCTTDSPRDEAQTPAKDTRLPPIFPILPKRKAVIAIAQGLLSLMPASLRPYLNRLLYALRSRATRLLSNDRLRRLAAPIWSNSATTSLIKNGTPKLATVTSNEASGLFSPGDVLISVGLDWDHSYYKHFYALRTFKGVKVVTCCYDLIPVLYPQYCVNDVAGIFTSYFLELADGSDLMLCISKQSEKDLNELLDRTGGARPPTHVVPMGDNVPTAGNEEISEEVQALCKEPFILFVSTIERRKNHEVLYRAYHLLCTQGRKQDLPKIVFVGMQGWGVAELLKDIELDPVTRSLIVRLNHVNDAELRALYEAAKFCVFPSLYEGWGLPVGEALSMGKAIICSNRGSLPEVGGELVRYVDPWSPQAWADELYRMSTDDEWRMHWEQMARKNYRTRTWAAAATSVKERITEMINPAIKSLN